ncbi:hypothetical protein N7519_002137 [Penicillium mononematosum]|uniref:uncharacterized protein n=1 Tax=Penicillium mononematosum TaxID=268346 RepID=UPI00254805E0|nr:uncharacterized protein N7519_002137 [Penicillium mononematosum]KAJ6187229.1 hypothetical protein N7519_002137 [Penicillium mononematosum]
MQNQPFSSERTPFSLSSALDTLESASQTPRSLHTDAADADPEHVGDDEVRDTGIYSESKVRDVGTYSEPKVRDNTLLEPVLTSAIQTTIPSVETGGVEYEDEISESEMQLSDGINTANIISGSRSRKPRQDPDYVVYLAMEEDEPPALNWNEVKSYLYAKDFIAVAEFEIDMLRRKETFSQVPIPNIRTTQILLLKWVFIYKFDADGVLDKFKARICVRGDLQWMTPEEKRAAILAVKIARAVFSMAARYSLITNRRVDTPLSIEPLLPFDGVAIASQIYGFQAKYATTISRPDAAKATSKLAEFLLNPGPKHLDAIDRYGVQMKDENSSLQLAAKSVEFKTITTSTTEAELLALSEAVLESLGFKPSHKLSIACDNQQTVDLLTKEGATMHTKLRHVDINRLWMKQEVNAGRTNVYWIPTAEMPADGLTKILPRQKQQAFRHLLGMREIRYLIIP